MEGTGGGGGGRKGWKAEYAKSGRATCRVCKSTISMETLRLGKMVQSQHFDGFMPLWHHASCIFNNPINPKNKKKPNNLLINSVDDVDGIETLRCDDQQKITHYITTSTSTSSSTTVTVTPSYAIEVSQSSRASCKSCSNKILKSQVRISCKPPQGALTWHHFNCFLQSNPSVQVHSLPGWDALPVSDRNAVLSFLQNLAPPPPHLDIGTHIDANKNKKPPPPNSKAGAKRKNDDDADHSSKKVGKTEIQPSNALESLLEVQSRELWALKDDLKKHVTTAELRQMLQANSQDSSGSELDLRDRW